MRNKPISKFKNHNRTIFHSYVQRQKHSISIEPNNLWGKMKFKMFIILEKPIAALYYLCYILSRKPTFRVYKDPKGGIFRLNNEKLSIGLLSDWANATDISQKIGKLLKDKHCDINIHMGDIYYIGEADEVYDNFDEEQGDFPYGELGNFAIPGNHEYFSNATGFFDVLLPKMGIKTNATIPQESGFFCLENDFWRIIGLDTGYHSVEKKFFKKTLGQDAHLDKKIIDWLKSVVKPNKDERGIILLTHHQPKSAFEEFYPKIYEALSAIFDSDRKIIWLWGHEHRLSFYGVHAQNDKLKAFGRCIGHGGMPVEILPLKKSDADQQSLIAYDERINPAYENNSIGYNGFATIQLDKNKATIEYFDITLNEPLIREEWINDMESNSLTGTIQNIANALTIYDGRSINDAVKVK